MTKLSIKGVDELKSLFNDLAPNEIKNISRAAVYSVASDIAKEIKRDAPVETGDMKKSVKSRRMKGGGNNYSKVRAGVFIPDMVAQSAKRPSGLLTWKQVEYGSLSRSANPFVENIRKKYRTQFSSLMKEAVVKKIIKFMEKKMRKVK